MIYNYNYNFNENQTNYSYLLYYISMLQIVDVIVYEGKTYPYVDVIVLRVYIVYIKVQTLLFAILQIRYSSTSYFS